MQLCLQPIRLASCMYYGHTVNNGRDGGIDWVLSERFGWQLSERLQEIIKGEDYFGELLVRIAQDHA